ncbi:MAG: hypothetical protein LBD11_07760 [Candidatus Peribacteria bacterium]|jgi:serine/threonine protein kinase|nr:hypothetical protein [Candidatus Peribacteria bacterium]
MTSEFLRFMQEENLPIFSAEERKKIASRITNTLDIFHKHHFYHRDLGENPRNLMFKRENGEYIPYIIDFGLATEDVRYQEGPEAKYDPLHTSRTSVTETYYAKDSAILSFITSGEEA